MRLKDYSPALKFGAKIYPDDTVGLVAMNDTNGYWFVDGDVAASGMGTDWNNAFKTIQEAVTAASAGDTIFVAARTMAATSTDPVSYTENVVINKASLSIIGVSRGRTQGGLPQVKVGTTTSSPIFSVKAPSFFMANMGINGAGATGSGVKYFDDGGTTYSSFGSTITGCHFKNCRGSSATNGTLGGAIALSGAPWQLNFSGNQFYKNLSDVVLLDTSNAAPQDVVISGNDFLGLAASVDCHLYLAAGSGMASVTVRDNYFADVKPAVGSGTVARYVDMTNCTGLFANNYFACTDTTTGFGAAKATAKIATTVGIAHNYSDGGLIVREA